LASAQQATRSVLEELQHIVHILRDPEPDGVNSRQPAPDFRAIEDLILSFTDTGLDVDFQVSGRSETMSTATGLVAYRIIQEALTNAQKHGNGQATVDITCGDLSITILITNSVAEPDNSVGQRSGTGYGLIGMRERVRMIDGSLEHALGAGTFTLRAELPLSPRGTDFAPISPGASRND
jgi:signal transduction histidine kinase